MRHLSCKQKALHGQGGIQEFSNTHLEFYVLVNFLPSMLNRCYGLKRIQRVHMLIHFLSACSTILCFQQNRRIETWNGILTLLLLKTIEEWGTSFAVSICVLSFHLKRARQYHVINTMKFLLKSTFIKTFVIFVCLKVALFYSIMILFFRIYLHWTMTNIQVILYQSVIYFVLSVFHCKIQ